MPRIVPIQLLKCLKVLLNANGGILSNSEVKRISDLMTKYSKKLVSKCIYVQILKCTDTELLGEFMGVGGWALVHSWLSDGIRLMNWPLVQEILELLLLCPVDVNRLKLNSAPKLVKGLCATGGNEGVRILAKRLVEQWLKIVTEGNDFQNKIPAQQQQIPSAVTPAALANLKTESTTSIVPPVKTELVTNNESEDQDPLDVPDNSTVVDKSLPPTAAQKKAGKTGLVYKFIVRNGQQLLTKVGSQDEEVGANLTDGVDETDIIEEDGDESVAADLVEEDSTSMDKSDDKEGEGSEESTDGKKLNEKKSGDVKVRTESKDHDEQSKNKESKNRESKSDKDKDHKSSSRRSSSSSSHNKSSSKSSSSSSSKSKSSSHRSSDKYRSGDKDRSSSSSSSTKDKDRSSSSSSSKHKSSSSSNSKSSSSSSSSSKDRHRDKEKDKSSSSSSSSSKRDKEREKEIQAERDKDTLAKMIPPSLDKLGKIPKKPKDEKKDDKDESGVVKATSITIPSKKASISIEIRRDAEKSSAVKTYKSQFRSHGLTEEAPPPPSRKALKKPASTTPQPGMVLPTALPSSLKRPSPPPRETSTEKKAKVDMTSISPAAAVEKPGAIKLIPPKRIQTLVETNIFSDALSAATGPKKVIKRKRPTSATGKDEPGTPTSPDAPKVAPLKFYQDTLDESAKSSAGAASSSSEDKAGKAKDDEANNNSSNSSIDIDKDGINVDEDDDIPLKKVKEDIEQRVRKEKAKQLGIGSGDSIDVNSDDDKNEKTGDEETEAVNEVKKPGPGCGPDGPPGVLMLHRRKGPKKKLTWRPQEQLEQVRYFELDENERINVMKISFLDMKNMERFNERASVGNLTRRVPRPGDTQEPRTEWRPLIELDDVPMPPNGAQSKERKVQADREMTTLRALYFSPNMIPDSPSEAEIEYHNQRDPPIIPLDDITGNPDTINDFSGMPWPEPKGSPKQGDNTMAAGTGGLNSLGNMPADLFSNMAPNSVLPPNNANNNMNGPFNNNFMNSFGGVGGGNPGPGPGPGPNNMPPGPQQMHMPPGNWQGGPLQGVPTPLMGNAFQGHPANPDMMGGNPNFMPPHAPFGGPVGRGGGPPPFMQGNNNPFGPPPGFNGPNFNGMGQGGPMGGPPMMNNMGPNPLMNLGNMGPRGGGGGGGGGNNNGNMRNNGPNWRNGPNNFPDNNNMGGGGGGGGGWRPAGPGQNRSGSNNMGNNNNSGICKAYLRGNCRLGKACRFTHPAKSKRL